MLKRSIIFLVAIAASYILHAQTANYAAQDSALARLRNDYPQEDVFLQLDKTYYFAGETIWFKAWCTMEGMPSFLSRIIYVDLVDQSGTVIQKKMYKLDSLSSIGGDITIPSEIRSGNFSINAYSLWMLNFPSFVFRKTVFIYGNDYTIKKTAASAAAVNVAFYPEGGDLINGISNRMAFKITDANGMPLSARGTIENQAGKKIADMITEHDGMGVAEFDMQTGEEYTGYVAVANGTARMAFRLPKAKEEGIVLKIENSNPNRLFVLLNRAEKNKQLYSRVKIVAQINYQVVYAINLNLDEGQTAATISKKNLPPGIIQITVFNDKDLPLAERITFIENYTVSSPKVQVEKKDMQARGKNLLSFSVDSIDLATLSCVVSSHTGLERKSYDDNIVSSLLLSANLKGYIHEAGYYFKDKTSATLRHLDLLLMTQGWRRFEWKKILNKDFTKLVYPVESAISFRGTLFKSDRKDPVKDGRVSFIIKAADSTSILAEAITTDKGEFLLNDVNYRQNAVVAYMGTNKNKENLIVDVKLVPNYIDSLKRSLNKPLVNLDTARIALPGSMQEQLNTLLGDSSVKLLQGVTVRAKRISREDSLNNEYAGGPFLMGKTIDPVNFKNYITIWQMIQAAVPGVTVEGNPFDPTVSFSRFAGLGSQTGDAGTSTEGLGMAEGIVQEVNGIAYFLNEVNVSKEIINSLIVEDVALIKVLKNEATVLGATQGAIAIYTKKGLGTGRSVFDKTYTKEEHAGYAVSKEFAPPIYVYDTDAKITDNRQTLYWNGHISRQKDGRYHFIFYNNDTGSKARIIIQGIDKEGQMIYREQVIE
jgi:hypothetical protein